MAEALSLATAVAPLPTCAEAVLAVENMDCGACIFPVEAALRSLSGVNSVRANLSLRRVSINYEPMLAEPDQFVRALDDAGFTAAEISGDAQSVHDDDLLPRLGVAAFAAMNIMLLSVSVWSGAGNDMDASTQALFHRISAVIAIPTVAYAGYPFFKSAAKALSAGRLNMDVPISLGVLLATAMSNFQTLRGSDQVYFDAAVTLLAFLLAGRLLDRQMRQRAESGVRNLLSLKSPSAYVIAGDGTQHKLPVKDLQPGMRICAAAGERIPADGVICVGVSPIDESLITGEAVPRRAGPQQIVYAGTINLGGPLEIEVTATDERSMLSQIISLMSAAEQAKGKYVRLADRAAQIYAPAVHVLGATTFLLWLISGYSWQEALTAAIAVLIVTCPCALALAVPVVQVAASSRLFDAGILLKRADGLERLAEIDTVVFDKTGTLTDPEPAIAEPERIDMQVLARAASLALASRHPYARALVTLAKARGIIISVCRDAREIAGFGIEVVADGKTQRLGSAEFTGADVADTARLFYRDEDGLITGFEVKEMLRSDARSVVRALEALGYGTELLSGDREEAVKTAALRAGIETWTARATPQAKVARLKELNAKGYEVLMVGDGLNDSPALAAAHASLAPSSGIDVSHIAADAVFQGKRLHAVIACLRVARLARRLAFENFAIAVGYNVVFVPLAMLGHVTPLIAAVAMSLSSITVIANALRLQSLNLESPL